MIAPNMATMLAVVMTDALIEASVADDMLRAAVADSFNSITVEGHTSTSDTVLLLANGASGVTLSADGRDRLTAAVNEVCCELAQAIIRDAEGAEHFVTITARGFASHADAREIARTVANDALVKTAVAGNDPNWGRIVSACGRTAVRLTERNLSLHVNGELIFERGTPCPFDAARLSQSMASGEVEIEILSDLGDDAARFWTSDLTQEYVRLNSEYTT